MTHSGSLAWVSTSKAAERLGVSPSTVRNMLNEGRLSGDRGAQPVRRRWQVRVNAEGYLVDEEGQVVAGQKAPRASLEMEVDELRGRVERIEQRLGPSGGGTNEERYQEASLLLSATLERQREALDLQMRANQQLSSALAEQGRIITTLLIPDVIAPDSDESPA
jgi:hypothetical protein